MSNRIKYEDFLNLNISKFNINININKDINKNINKENNKDDIGNIGNINNKNNTLDKDELFIMDL